MITVVSLSQHAVNYQICIRDKALTWFLSYLSDRSQYQHWWCSSGFSPWTDVIQPVHKANVAALHGQTKYFNTSRWMTMKYICHLLPKRPRNG